MDMIIRGETPPKSCGECQNKYDVCTAKHNSYDDFSNPPPPDCPLEGVETPHGKLIDADDLIMRVENSDYYDEALEGNFMYTSDIVKTINEAPEVVEEALE